MSMTPLFIKAKRAIEDKEACAEKDVAACF